MLQHRPHHGFPFFKLFLKLRLLLKLSKPFRRHQRILLTNKRNQIIGTSQYCVLDKPPKMQLSSNFWTLASIVFWSIIGTEPFLYFSNHFDYNRHFSSLVRRLGNHKNTYRLYRNPLPPSQRAQPSAADVKVRCYWQRRSTINHRNKKKVSSYNILDIIRSVDINRKLKKKNKKLINTYLNCPWWKIYKRK